MLEIELSSNATSQIQSIAQMLEINEFKNRNMKNLNEMLIYQLGNSTLQGTNNEMLYSLYLNGYSSLNYPSLMNNPNYLYQGFGDKANVGLYSNGIDYSALAGLRPDVKENLIQQIQSQTILRAEDLRKSINNQPDTINNSHSKIDIEEKQNNVFSNQSSGMIISMKVTFRQQKYATN